MKASPAVAGVFGDDSDSDWAGGGFTTCALSFLPSFLLLSLPHLQLIEVPRLEVRSELQLLTYTTASHMGSEPRLQPTP